MGVEFDLRRGWRWNPLVKWYQPRRVRATRHAL